jgi:hypothetical protein
MAFAMMMRNLSYQSNKKKERERKDNEYYKLKNKENTADCFYQQSE